MDLWDDVADKFNGLETRVKELEAELKLNTSMLAKQCDMARGAEVENQRLCKIINWCAQLLTVSNK